MLVSSTFFLLCLRWTVCKTFSNADECKRLIVWYRRQTNGTGAQPRESSLFGSSSNFANDKFYPQKPLMHTVRLKLVPPPSWGLNADRMVCLSACSVYLGTITADTFASILRHSWVAGEISVALAMAIIIMTQEDNA